MLEKLSPEMIAKQVQLEAGLMGDRTYRALCDVAGREMEFVGADGSAVLVAMVGGWQDYEKSKPNLEFQWVLKSSSTRVTGRIRQLGRGRQRRQSRQEGVAVAPWKSWKERSRFEVRRELRPECRAIGVGSHVAGR